MNKVNWKKNLLCKQSIALLTFTIFINCGFCQNTLKMKSKDVNGQHYPYLKIGSSANVFPCGEEFSISLEDETRFIFSAASIFNASLTANGNLDYPNDGVGVNGKRVFKTYTESFERIRNLKVGYNTTYEKWNIDETDILELYSSDAFEVNYNDKERTAINYNNIFHEMLISIQTLANKNDNLTATIENQNETIEQLVQRIENLEGDNTPTYNYKTIGNVNINPNPSTNNNILVNYTINDTFQNVELILTDLQGKTLYQVNLNKQKGTTNINLNLPTGNYIYYLKSNSQKTSSKKLIIQ